MSDGSNWIAIVEETIRKCRSMCAASHFYNFIILIESNMRHVMLFQSQYSSSFTSVGFDVVVASDGRD
jgi:hypothetical protein